MPALPHTLNGLGMPESPCPSGTSGCRALAERAPLLSLSMSMEYVACYCGTVVQTPPTADPALAATVAASTKLWTSFGSLQHQSYPFCTSSYPFE